ncbi:hypothetical protein [Priestia flexa]|uniref:hypothetical protein n=1 Tax=Priestia flexa TaxID=86664 RepID=UPI00077C7321|nr:hypothetical protein [Priestia flexa]MED4590705.1 hypothetical protein [Priestia flexa]
MSTLVRLGYVAMSVQLQNASPSQTMTFAQFQRIQNREAAISKLERISISNLENCLRLLKHNVWSEHENPDWTEYWSRIVAAWEQEKLPLKMHISSPKSSKDFRAHADYINAEEFYQFLQSISGTIPQIDCMIEAKQKDAALFQLMNDLKTYERIEIVNGSTFIVK